jgi:hypothetical protein
MTVEAERMGEVQGSSTIAPVMVGAGHGGAHGYECITVGDG